MILSAIYEVSSVYAQQLRIKLSSPEGDNILSKIVLMPAPIQTIGDKVDKRQSALGRRVHKNKVRIVDYMFNNIGDPQTLGCRRSSNCVAYTELSNCVHSKSCIGRAVSSGERRSGTMRRVRQDRRNLDTRILNFKTFISNGNQAVYSELKSLRDIFGGTMHVRPELEEIFYYVLRVNSQTTEKRAFNEILQILKSIENPQEMLVWLYNKDADALLLDTVGKYIVINMQSSNQLSQLTLKQILDTYKNNQTNPDAMLTLWGKVRNAYTKLEQDGFGGCAGSATLFASL